MREIKNLLISISSLFLLLSTAGANAQDCEEFNIEIPAYFKKGYLEVPENWDEPNGRQIKIFYYGNFGTAHQTPTVFFNGGPSQSSHIPFGQFQTDAKSANVPLIYIDQRGTGCSSPYPEQTTDENIKRLAFYGSRAIVKDAEAIRKKLFKNKKWQVFGQSYGGLIAHRYLEVAPEGISSVFIHGHTVTNTWRNFYKQRLLSQQRVLEIYFNSFPEDRALLKHTQEQIPADLCFNSGSIKICGPAIVDALVLLLGFRNNWDNLHLSLHSLTDKGGKFLPARLARFAHAFVLTPFNSQSLATAIIAKMEMNDGDDNNQCLEALKQLEAAGEKPNDWLLNECRLALSIQSLEDNSSAQKLLANFKTKDPLKLDLISAALKNIPNLKMFLYSGQLDVYVPQESFIEEIQTLSSRIRFRLFEDSGHDGYLTESTLWDDIKGE